MNVLEKYLTFLNFPYFFLIKPITPAPSKSFWNNFPLAEAKPTAGSKISWFFESYLDVEHIYSMPQNSSRCFQFLGLRKLCINAFQWHYSQNLTSFSFTGAWDQQENDKNIMVINHQQLNLWVCTKLWENSICIAA